MDPGHAVTDLDGLALLRDVVEEGEERIEIALRERVVFVIMAARAAHREAHPDCAGGVHAIDHILDRELLGHDAALGIATVIAIERGGDLLRKSRTWQKITADLLDGELIKRHVRVEGVDHPVAPAPHPSLTVALVAARVRVTRGIQPADGHALAEAGTREQTIHQSGVGFGGFRGSSRQAGEIQRDASLQGSGIRFGRWRQALVL